MAPLPAEEDVNETEVRKREFGVKDDQRRRRPDEPLSPGQQGRLLLQRCLPLSKGAYYRPADPPYRQ